jgi:hypothetical protein
LTDKKGIPLSVVISPASTHDIKQVIEVVDNAIIKRPKQPSTSKSRRGTRRRRLLHLCLDKGYNSAEEEEEEEEEQKLIKRGYVLHIPVKKKKRGEEEKDYEQKSKAIRIVKNILLKDGL